METVRVYKRGRDQVKAIDWIIAILLGVVGALVFLAYDVFFYGS